MAATILTQVFFSNNMGKFFRVERGITAGSMCDLIVDRIELKTNVKEFKLFAIMAGGERSLQDDELPAELYDSWGKQETNTLIPLPRLVFRRMFFMASAGEAEYSTDPVYRELMYFQAIESVIQSPFVLDDTTSSQLAALMLAHQHGPFNELTYKSGILHKHIATYIPNKVLSLHDEAVWEGMIMERYKELSPKISHDELELTYLATHKTLPVYGMTFFPAKYVTRGSSRVSARVLLAIDCDGISIFDLPSMTLRVSYKYSLIFSWACADNSFSIKTDEISEGLPHTFVTTLGEEISLLIEGYIVRILATMNG